MPKTLVKRIDMYVHGSDMYYLIKIMYKNSDYQHLIATYKSMNIMFPIL